MSITNRNSNGITMTPPKLQSGVESLRTCPHALGPFGYCQGFVVVGKKHIVAPVSGLLNVSCPPNIARFVVAVLVWVAIQGVTVAWGTANVRQESLKGFAPFITDDDSSIPMIFCRPASGVIAAVDHRCPCFIFMRSIALLSRLTMRAPLISEYHSSRVIDASATDLLSCAQVASANKADSLALFATASPHRIPLPARGMVVSSEFHYSQIPELSPSQVLHALAHWLDRDFNHSIIIHKHPMRRYCRSLYN